MHGHGADGERPAAQARKKSIERKVQKNREQNRETGERWKPQGKHRRQADQGHAEALFHPQVQIVRHGAAAEHQQGPGDGPIENVGAQQARQVPALEMLYLQIGVKTDAPTGPANRGAELDVLHRRPRPVFWKASGLEKETPPDGAAPGPECAGVATAVMMDKGMEQIFVLREEV